MNCDVGEATEGLENELGSAHSPTFPSLHLRHNSFSNPSVALPTSQFILQLFFRFSYVKSSPFRRFTYVSAHSPTLPLLHLRHSSFYSPSFASPTSQTSLNSPGEPPMSFTQRISILFSTWNRFFRLGYFSYISKNYYNLYD